MRLFTFLILAFFACRNTHAQANITDGKISYEISIDSDEPAAAILALGATLEVAFKGSKTRLEASVGGGSNTVRIVADNSKTAGMAVMNVLNEKKAVKIGTKELEDAQRDLKTLAKNPIKYLDSYKTIAGYECQKVLMKDLQSGANIILYITDKINPKNDKVAQQLFGQLKGFPLGIMIRKNANTVKVMARKVTSTAPNDSAFSMSVPSGYQLTTIKELEALFQGKI